jgi:hypothetical protein
MSKWNSLLSNTRVQVLEVQSWVRMQLASFAGHLQVQVVRSLLRHGVCVDPRLWEPNAVCDLHHKRVMALFNVLSALSTMALIWV